MLHDNPRPGLASSRIARRFQLLLSITGLLALTYCGWAVVQAHAAQKEAAAFTGKPGQTARAADSQEQILPSGEPENSAGATKVIGRIEIPEINLSAPITAGITTEGLLRGAGHVPGTAFPGGLGTMGIAGHRDTFFRPLRHIKEGMKIRVTDATGAYHYQVDSTEVVSPENVQVLDIGSRPKLTLVTCYPFNFIGHAPLRFIVHAHLLSVAPDGQ
jgi:sortase A